MHIFESVAVVFIVISAPGWRSFPWHWWTSRIQSQGKMKGQVYSSPALEKRLKPR